MAAEVLTENPLQVEVPVLPWEEREKLAEFYPDIEDKLLSPWNAQKVSFGDEPDRYNPNKNTALGSYIARLSEQLGWSIEYTHSSVGYVLFEAGVSAQSLGVDVTVFVGNLFGDHDKVTRQLSVITPDTVVLSKIFMSPEFRESMRFFYAFLNPYSRFVDSMKNKSGGLEFPDQHTSNNFKQDLHIFVENNLDIFAPILNFDADQLPGFSVREAYLKYLKDQWKFEEKTQDEQIQLLEDYENDPARIISEIMWYAVVPGKRNHGIAVSNWSLNGRKNMYRVNHDSSIRMLENIIDSLRERGINIIVVPSNFEDPRSHIAIFGNDVSYDDPIDLLSQHGIILNKGWRINELPGQNVLLSGTFFSLLNGNSQDLNEAVNSYKAAIEEARRKGGISVGFWPATLYGDNHDLTINNPTRAHGASPSNREGSLTAEKLVGVLNPDIIVSTQNPNPRVGRDGKVVNPNTVLLIGPDGRIVSGLKEKITGVFRHVSEGKILALLSGSDRNKNNLTLDPSLTGTPPGVVIFEK